MSLQNYIKEERARITRVARAERDYASARDRYHKELCALDGVAEPDIKTIPRKSILISCGRSLRRSKRQGLSKEAAIAEAHDILVSLAQKKYPMADVPSFSDLAQQFDSLLGELYGR